MLNYPVRVGPTGALIELLTPHSGIGEIRLLRALCMPNLHRNQLSCFSPRINPISPVGRIGVFTPQRLLHLRPQRARDAYWAAEQILKNGSCAALLFWAHPVQTRSLNVCTLPRKAAKPYFLCFVRMLCKAMPHRQCCGCCCRLSQQAPSPCLSLNADAPACGHTITLASPPSELFLTITHDLWTGILLHLHSLARDTWRLRWLTEPSAAAVFEHDALIALHASARSSAA